MSENVFTPDPCRVGQRVILKANGYCDDDLNRPLIGVVNTYNEAHPGHCGYKDIIEFIKRGIYRAGGVAAEFETISICDGMGGSHIGENYILPSREIIADSIETVCKAENLDGRMTADDTLDARLEAKKADFYKNSGLSITL